MAAQCTVPEQQGDRFSHGIGQQNSSSLAAIFFKLGEKRTIEGGRNATDARAPAIVFGRAKYYITLQGLKIIFFTRHHWGMDVRKKIAARGECIGSRDVLHN